MIRLLMLGAMSAFLILSAGCSSRVVTRTIPVQIEVIRYIPIPAELTKECPGYQGPLETNGDLADGYATEKKEGTDCANEKLRRIGELR